MTLTGFMVKFKELDLTIALFQDDTRIAMIIIPTPPDL